ncbi:MAG: TlpA family protein disulfide reductase [Candidatus Eisenbacteria bacterium]|uniref:TlpA family protein disulfide reductase n=1 Tax=Eiseniibacteriota bacterium TaxID=2212470 RepID=A0A849SFJ9_UNCEI|nr:TlpA family protein disulfide reductase [Candidatus Eisenbacteria bacterium]
MRHITSLVRLAGGLTLAGVALIAGCSASPERAGHDASEHSDSTLAAAADSIGPALERVTAAELRARARAAGGRATLVNLWATWCAPCREEFPDIVRLAAAHRDRGLRVLFVSADFDDQAPQVRAFLAQHHAPEPWLLKTGDDQAFINGIDGRWSGALPATLVLDAQGNVTAFWEGRADYARFEQAVLPLLASSPAIPGGTP